MNQENKKIQFKTYLQYAQAATRTLVPVGEHSDVGHMGLGVATEFLELRRAVKNKDNVNIVEEIGDHNWYLANHLSLYFKDTDKVWKDLTKIYFKPQHSLLSIEDEMEYIESKVERYTDVCKKLFAYGKYVDGYHDELRSLVVEINTSLVAILLKINTVPQECLDKNINKLYKRYPLKFDSFLAMNRDLLKEYDVLKENIEA